VSISIPLLYYTSVVHAAIHEMKNFIKIEKGEKVRIGCVGKRFYYEE